MATFQLKRNGRVLTDQEKKEIMDELKAHQEDNTLIPRLMEKYNCSEANIVMIIAQEVWEKWRDEKNAINKE